MAFRHHHLAQVNIARMLAPLNSPVMAGFVAQLPTVNALAENSPGFVWRLTEATDVRILNDPLILINLSVWDSPGALKDFTYKTGHISPLRERAQWFERPAQPHFAMWWVPAGHTPSAEEAVQRLTFLRRHGESPFAFTFARLHEPPDEPVGERKPLAANLDRRILVSKSNTPNGDVDGATTFRYRQSGGRVWATYEGGRVHFGTLVAVADSEGRLDMRYQHWADGDQRTGRCTASIEILEDGRVRLHETWQWTNGDLSTGNSITEELAATRSSAAAC